jgi:hypothetical protein
VRGRGFVATRAGRNKSNLLVLRPIAGLVPITVGGATATRRGEGGRVST